MTKWRHVANEVAEPTQQQRFEVLFDQHQRSVLGFALRRVREPADAADVVAEVFLVAWRRIDDIPEGENSRAWLLGAARKVLANERRGTQRRNGLAERLRREIVKQSPPTERDAISDCVMSVLDEMSDRDREILLLTAWEELSPAEIGVVLGLRTVTVRSRMHRARKRFEEKLIAGGWAPPVASPASVQPGAPTTSFLKPFEENAQ